MYVLDHRCLVKAGFLHRDICPLHILLGKQEGRPSGVLVDFNLATRCDSGKTPAENDAIVVSFTINHLLHSIDNSLGVLALLFGQQSGGSMQPSAAPLLHSETTQLY